VIKGLEKTPQYNGKTGVIVGRLDSQDNRLAVKLSHSAQILRVKPENLELIVEAKEPPIPPKSACKTPQELGADRWVPGSVDLSKLTKWTGSLEDAFGNQQFSIFERIASQAGTRPARGKNPVHDVKETLVVVAHMADAGKPVLLLLDDAAKQEGLALHVVAAHVCDAAAEDPRPLIVVHHWTDFASPEQDRISALMASAPPPPTP
jgi:hypothetical protein